MHVIINVLAAIGGFTVLAFLYQFVMLIVEIIELDRKADKDNETKATAEDVR